MGVQKTEQTQLVQRRSAKACPLWVHGGAAGSNVFPLYVLLNIVVRLARFRVVRATKASTDEPIADRFAGLVDATDRDGGCPFVARNCSAVVGNRGFARLPLSRLKLMNGN